MGEQARLHDRVGDQHREVRKVLGDSVWSIVIFWR